MKPEVKQDWERELYQEIKEIVLSVENAGRDRLGEREIVLIEENIGLLNYLQDR